MAGRRFVGCEELINIDQTQHTFHVENLKQLDVSAFDYAIKWLYKIL